MLDPIGGTSVQVSDVPVFLIWSQKQIFLRPRMGNPHTGKPMWGNEYLNNIQVT
jgi:hypothetical protein